MLLYRGLGLISGKFCVDPGNDSMAVAMNGGILCVSL